MRAAQALVTHAQLHGLESQTWQSLARAARWYLDRNQQRKAGILTTPAWVLAGQTENDRPRRPGRRSRDTVEDTELLAAIIFTAYHELWSGNEPCDGMYDEVLREFDLGSQDSGLRLLIEQAREVVRNRVSPEA